MGFPAINSLPVLSPMPPWDVRTTFFGIDKQARGGLSVLIPEQNAMMAVPDVEKHYHGADQFTDRVADKYTDKPIHIPKSGDFVTIPTLHILCVILWMQAFSADGGGQVAKANMIAALVVTTLLFILTRGLFSSTFKQEVGEYLLQPLFVLKHVLTLPIEKLTGIHVPLLPIEKLTGIHVPF